MTDISIHTAFASHLRDLYNSNKENYEKQLEQNTMKIIDNLGGLHNIIQLCLTNKNVSQTITHQNIDYLKTLTTQESTIDIKIQPKIPPVPNVVSISLLIDTPFSLILDELVICHATEFLLNPKQPNFLSIP